MKINYYIEQDIKDLLPLKEHLDIS